MLATLVAAVDVVYGGAVAGLWADWWHDENYAHRVLVVPAACWLIWSRRTRSPRCRANRQPAAPSRRAQPWRVPRGPGGAVATATDLARQLEPQIRQQLLPARPTQPGI
jgi:hypothetical protein